MSKKGSISYFIQLSDIYGKNTAVGPALDIWVNFASLFI